MKWASLLVIEPFGSPGKTRFMFLPSIGDSRRAALNAGTLSTGMTINRPSTMVDASKLCTRFLNATGPSYSSPCVPPIATTVLPGFGPHAT